MFFLSFLILISCKKEDMNRKFHWRASVKTVAGYPVTVYRGAVYGKDGGSVFGGGYSYEAEKDEPFPHFSIDDGVSGLFASVEGKPKGVPTHLDVSWLSYVEGCEYLLEDQPLDSVKIAQLLEEKVYVFSKNKENPAPEVQEYNITVGLAPGGVVLVWLHNWGRVEEVGRYQATKIKVIDFVSEDQANSMMENPNVTIPLENTIERRRYVIKKGMPKKRVVMEYNECATPARDSYIAEEDLFNIPYGLWDSYRKKYKWKMTLETRDKTKYIHSYFYSGLNREMEELFGERVWKENQIEKYKIPEKFRYTYLSDRSIPAFVYIKWYDEQGAIYRAGIVFNVKEVMDVFTKAFRGQENEVGELVLGVNSSKTDFFCYLKVGGRKEWICNGDFFIFEDSEI
jgi:hypothetical protein